MAHDMHHFDLPSELWFKVIAFVLSDSIHSVCCSTPGETDLSWERNAFGTLRLVSKSFSHITFKVADLVLAGRYVRIRGATLVDREQDKTMDVDEDENIDDLDKLKLIYDRFKMINYINSNPDLFDFFAQSGVAILFAYYEYVQLFKNCKSMFSRSGLFFQPDLETNVFVSASQQHLAFMEKIHGLFPLGIKNILHRLNRVTVPEMVEKLRSAIERDSMFFASSLEIVYRCAQVINQEDEWQSPVISTEFRNYLDSIYVVMKASAEFYSSELKDRVPGDYPIISKLPGVGMAIEIIVHNGHHHQALADLVNSWV